MRPLLGAVALLMASAPALAQEYRVFTLSDGRVFVSELLATEAAGLRIVVPPGETEVPFTLLVDMVPSDAEAFNSQEPFVVLLDAPEENYLQLEHAFNKVPGLVVHGTPAAPKLLTPDQVQFAKSCEGEIDCLQAATEGVPWLYLVGVTVDEQTGTTTITSRLNTGTTGYSASYVKNDWVGLQLATYNGLGFSPKGEPEALTGPLFPDLDPVVPEEVVGDTRTPKERAPVDANKAAFMPVPGLAALQAGDMATFGLTCAVVLPATALWVAATGKNSQNVGEHAALSVGGFYAFTVLANHAFAGRIQPASSDIALSVSRTEHGGAAVGVQITR